MKLEEKIRARELRYQGFSIEQIASSLSVSKGSVSAWVRDIILPNESLKNIENRRRLAREQSRNTHLSNTAKIYLEFKIKCKEEILPFSDRDLWIAGLMIYAGEGNKTPIVSSQRIEVTNSDPAILRLFINFLSRICSVSKEKIKIRLMLYEDINIKEAIGYWSNELNIPPEHFQRPFIKQSYKDLPNRHLRRSQYGTAHIIVYDIKIYRKIINWLEAVYEYNNLDFIK